MKQFLSLTLFVLLMTSQAFAQDVQGVLNVVAGEETLVLTIPDAIKYDTKSSSSPLDNGSGGWRDYIAVDSPQELVRLQEQYGGMLYASTNDLCEYVNRGYPNVAYTNYGILYGLVGAVIGVTGVNFRSRLDLDALIAPAVEALDVVDAEGLAPVRQCTLVGFDTVVVRVRLKQ